MPGPDLVFDGRDLAPAAGDSSGLLPPFLGDLVEAAAVAVEHRRLSHLFLIAPADYIGVARVEFHQAGFTVATLAAD